MTGEARRSRITMPTPAVLDLARLLTEVDEFLRSAPAVTIEMERFLERRGHCHPGFAVGNLIDEVSFTAAWLRSITDAKAGRQPRPDTGPG
jgi:hypothetical protein